MVVIYEYNFQTSTITFKHFINYYDDYVQAKGRFLLAGNDKLYGLTSSTSYKDCHIIEYDYVNDAYSFAYTFSSNGGSGFTPGEYPPNYFHASLVEGDNGILYGVTNYISGYVFGYGYNAPTFNNYNSQVLYPTINMDDPMGDLTVVAAPPIVTNQPVGFTACENSTNHFLSFSNIGGNSYQWFQNGGPVAGATDTILNFDTLEISNSGYYYCQLTSQNGISYSDSTQIIVNPLPNVLVNATPNVLCEGDSVLLVGSGATSYVWNNSVVNGIPFTYFRPNICGNRN